VFVFPEKSAFILCSCGPRMLSAVVAPLWK
jgi:hypothetical protein